MGYACIGELAAGLGDQFTAMNKDQTVATFGCGCCGDG